MTFMFKQKVMFLLQCGKSLVENNQMPTIKPGCVILVTSISHTQYVTTIDLIILLLLGL